MCVLLVDHWPNSCFTPCSLAVTMVPVPVHLLMERAALEPELATLALKVFVFVPIQRTPL